MIILIRRSSCKLGGNIEGVLKKIGEGIRKFTVDEFVHEFGSL